MNMQFAIFYIPDDSEFYAIGSKIIGYDILKKTPVDTLKSSSKAYKYGFHLTITDVVDIQEEKMSEVIRRTKKIFSLAYFRGLKIKKKLISRMPNANVFAIQYTNNIKLFLLHLLLVVFVQRLGIKSDYSTNTNMLSLFQKIKTKVFLSPYILNDYLPHISLAYDLTYDEQQNMINRILPSCTSSNRLDIRKIAVVVKNNNEENFRIVEFIANL